MQKNVMVPFLLTAQNYIKIVNTQQHTILQKGLKKVKAQALMADESLVNYKKYRKVDVKKNLGVLFNSST